MNYRIFGIIVFSMLVASVAHAQSSNCCQIEVGGVTSTGGTGSVAASASGPGGVYINPQTETYPIACINSETQKPCNSTGMPNNVVTATGAGANHNGNFVACNPTFSPNTSQSSSSSSTAASFLDQGTGYMSVDSNGNCVQQNPQPFAKSTCIVVACQTCPQCPRQRVCTSGCSSPIILDVTGDGFFLTSAANGVKFDIMGNGTVEQIGWTAPGANNGFLALPGADGLVHNGKQLFGNFTSQPPSATPPNGFIALAVYDDPKNGGNGDGIIDARDAIFGALRLWIDANHDGISQPEEMHTLASLGVNSISLKYKEDDKTDRFGNVFRYRARLNPDGATDAGKWAYDVFFDTLNPAAKNKACPVPSAGPLPQKAGGF